ncbi:MAG: YfhO family protein, partial [Bacteroidia bacterium]|nr:YfhO family protein [Bacteroidia bacterium]
MNNNFMKKALPHLVAVGVIFIAMFFYFQPFFGGKVLKQYDVSQWRATYEETSKFETQSGERTYWTNSIFGGMPNYLIGASYTGNWTNSIYFKFQQVFKHPTDTVFLLFICFYIMLLVFEVNAWLAIIGALAFAFSSFNFINIDAGHITKGNAIAFIPLVIAGVQMCLHKNRIMGALLTGIALSLQLAANHLQITYYLIFIIIAWVIVEIVDAVKNGTFKNILLSGVFLGVAALVAVGTNITGLLTTEEYGKYSLRAPSELTVAADGATKADNGSTGLDKDYALAWSNGVTEPLTLLIPNFYGGASNGELSTNSETFKLLKSAGYDNANAKQAVKQMPIYWGDQPFTAGPIYYGAIICFLFVFGMIVVKSNAKWWILAASLLAIFLSMGKNFMPLTNIFFDYFPLYNKFRSVTFILCITQALFPLMALLALRDLMNNKISKTDLMNGLKFGGGIVAGLCLLFAVVPGIFASFTGVNDAKMDPKLVEALMADRESIMRADAFRSFALIAAACALIWFYFNKKITELVFVSVLGLLVLGDLWQVDKRYLNDSDFEKKKAAVLFEKSPADEEILKDPDPNYRVYNNTTDFDKDAITSYYHKTIGGYHGAKMRRFQELIEWQLAKNNMECYNMLNVKYIILGDSTGQKFVQRNYAANGNAWFVSNVKMVANADEEIRALTGFSSKQTAIIDKRFEGELANFKMNYDSMASIKFLSYAPNKLVYETNASSPQLAVFSEVYYDKGWNAYIDGKLVPHIRANYVLRSMIVPEGKHSIEFKFEPATVKKGQTIALASSATLYIG